MEMMDLRTNQPPLRIEKNFEVKESYHETDIKGNNNFLTCFKTEVNSIIAHDGSLFSGGGAKEKELEVDNALFSYSSFKKAMDLRTHNRTVEEKTRTIFEDAEYFSENHRYKLLPITFEQVDESVIRLEHNYVLLSLNSESEPEEDCSRTMDYSRVLERNYKKRRTKLELEKPLEDGDGGVTEPSSIVDEIPMSNGETGMMVEPLDLSAAPLVQEEKTESHTQELHNSPSIGEIKGVEDSEKENSRLKGILVTITRPDEKENYEPCDLFLNDIARLVPWLIDKNCFEIDIMDRTCDPRDPLRNHRLYYVISEATWRLFQKSNERVILTNDLNLGEPLKRTEKEEKPSYLVFDQYSLAKCLAEFCQEIGGCFEYACVEEGTEETNPKEEPENKNEAVLKEKLQKAEEAVKDEKAEEAVKDEKAEEIVEVKEKFEENLKVNEEEKLEEIKKEEEKSPLVETEKVEESESKPAEKKSEFAEQKNKVSDEEKPINSVMSLRSRESLTEEPFQTKQKKPKTPPNPRLKTPRTTTELKSTSELDASQKSDKPMSKKRKKETEGSNSKEEPPATRRKATNVEETPRNLRSRKALEDSKTENPDSKLLGNKETAKKKGRKVKTKKKVPEKKKDKEKKTKEVVGIGRRLRSHKIHLRETKKKGRRKRMQ